ncbi:hypothetical protein OOZ15_18400 [Galbibacter sp. EGI 63066]|uniref:hypothetical protein n=1 Tax=Galbibacter sp. EGI 63066 TaxID=2993559 RepID=UPI0022497B83|nr:hypothetical protein [Galbibacter sp. EGI 63066]MCX2681929.1 hypothetical protein [Galbibacter sp. EGI 63066]
MKKLLQIDRLLIFLKKMAMFSIILSLVSVLASLSYGVYLQKKLSKSQVYILDRNTMAYTAKVVKDELTYREPEIINHMKLFQKYFFNLDQFNYKKHLEKALNLIDDSGKNYYLTLKSDGWYQNLKMNNLIQKFELDSIKVDVKEYPYSASIYGKTIVYKYGDEKGGDRKRIGINCKLYDVSRTVDNPHGLMISKYHILYHE